MQRVIRTTLTVGVLAIVAMAASTASASPNQALSGDALKSALSLNHEPSGDAPRSALSLNREPPGGAQKLATAYNPLERPNPDQHIGQTTVRRVKITPPAAATPSSGFDWGDAAVGAGITAAVALLIAGGALVRRRGGAPQHS